MEDIVNCQIPISSYSKIPKEIRDDIEVKKVEPDEYDYSDDEKWQLLKKESTKAYIKLKEREFKIRHSL